MACIFRLKSRKGPQSLDFVITTYITTSEWHFKWVLSERLKFVKLHTNIEFPFFIVIYQ